MSRKELNKRSFRLNLSEDLINNLEYIISSDYYLRRKYEYLHNNLNRIKTKKYIKDAMNKIDGEWFSSEDLDD